MAGTERYRTIAYDLAVFFYALEERGPFHEVCEVEVEVVVFGEGVEVAKVELQEIAGSDTADGRHDMYLVLRLCVLLSIHLRISGVRKRRIRCGDGEQKTGVH